MQIVAFLIAEGIDSFPADLGQQVIEALFLPVVAVTGRSSRIIICRIPSPLATHGGARPVGGSVKVRELEDSRNDHQDE
jgi:hypothetical protein